jgi:putative nucleotidyltransferase with HDIG domain
MLPPKVQQILNSIQSLKPLPGSVTRTLKELENPHATASIISEYIGLDQALAALVLQISNSAYLGYGRTCTSLTDAVMRLGFIRLKSILMASSASGLLSRSLVGYRQGAGELWQHSLAVAVAAEWLARAIGYRDVEEAYVSGLLHDIGKLMLDQFVLADYAEIVELIEKSHLPLWQVEEKKIGINHAMVGGLVAEKWHFPSVLIDTIQYHHSPSTAKTNKHLPAIINLANYIVISTSALKSPLFSSELNPDTVVILNVSNNDLANYTIKLQAKLQIAV